MARLVQKGGRPLTAGRALAMSFAWGLGAAIGVALGAWLTLVGESGAPGVQGLDTGTDLFAIPLAAFAVVFVAHLALQVSIAWARGRRADAVTGTGPGA
jgi:hypothetical protein